MDDRALDICIVSYARPDLLKRCIAALHTHLPESQIRIWDNRSARSPEIRELADPHPEIDWVFSEEPRGYAAGANALVARSRNDHDILLLNPDAVVTGPLRRTRAMLREPGVAAVSPTILDPTGCAERWDIAHRAPTVLRTVVNRAGYAGRLRGTLLSDLYTRPPSDVDGYVTGACFLVSREAWDDIGPFDERYFLYGDDADWQRRARERGWRVCLVDEPEVRHGGESTATGRAPASQRAVDYLAANSAVVFGGGPNSGPWTAVTAADVVLERVQRSRRRARREAVARQLARASESRHVLVTTRDLERGAPGEGRVSLANDLVRRGHPVTVVCLQALGPLQRELDDRVRIVLRPWWQPVVDVVSERPVLLCGSTPIEVGFGALWTMFGRARSWLFLDDSVPGSHRRLWTRTAVRVLSGDRPVGSADQPTVRPTPESVGCRR